MHPHYLTGKTKTYACSFLLGRIERNEDLLLAFLADRTAVIEYIYYDMFRKIDFCSDFYLSGICLDRILDQIDYDLGDLSLVCVQDDII